jgi:MtrB/PioB family decaheme-associated outer membrane protein
VRTLTLALVGCLAAWPALAQEPGGGPTTGEVVVGARVTAIEGDEARFDRYRDRRDGATLDRVRLRREAAAWAGSLEADRVGYRDQRFRGRIERFGSVSLDVEWAQTPLYESSTTRTPYTAVSPGVLRLDDARQAAVEAGADKVDVFAPAVVPFELRSRRDVAHVDLEYAATRTLSLELDVRRTARTGAQPYGASFGFSNAIELAAPVESQTHDVRAAAEWSTRRAMLRLAYDGSWFDNAVETLVWDNPLRLTDSTNPRAYIGGDAAAQGRLALWPDSRAHTVSMAGSVALPARSRAVASVSVGRWLQDRALLAHTINSAITPIPLARDTAQAEAAIVATQVRVTSRPTPLLWVSGQFRSYDFDNRTPRFAVDDYVRLDGTTATSATGGSEPFGYTRYFFDVDASVTPARFVAIGFGYGREQDRRTFRFFERTTEHVWRTSVDATGLSWGVARLEYERAVRTGEGLDEQVFGEIGEQISLRQFDISDRERDRVTGILQVLPSGSVGLTLSGAWGRTHRPDAEFGLRDTDVGTLTVAADAVPSDAVRLNASYAWERYTTAQRSRQANPGPQFDDPTRDWGTDVEEGVHTLTAGVELPELSSRLGAAVSYEFMRSLATYDYVLAQPTSLGTPAPLPPVRNRIQRLSADARYALDDRVALAFGYAYDRYDVEDFARSPGTLDSPLFPSFVSLSAWYAPYRVHTGTVRLIYAW